ncbi:transient receptor potential cation channel protein painless [Stomoxys calcitrans]|uniref:transient receptor potential cation channel protein painless n=1 Tax=Stomoxys calcitrans TaxID=35570 RepID=UPI0027E2C0BB|nr:transient receptor potential cation channel protein painless [Stomoxys calcitrans]
MVDDCCYPDESWRNKEFFLAIQNHDNRCFDRLFNHVDIQIVTQPVLNENYSAPRFALYCSNVYALQKLLATGLFQETHIKLCDALFNINDKYSKTADCIQVLANLQKISEEDVTAFVKAIEFVPEKFLLELLKKGLFLPIKSPEFVVTKVRPTVLSELFDSLIDMNENRFMSIDYSTFDKKKAVKDGITIATQMEIIEAIASRETHQQLLAHPIIQLFLDLKWRELSRLFYLNFCLYIFFVCSCVSYILCKLHEYEIWTGFFCALTVFGMIYLIVRECLHLGIDYKQYLRDLRNYMAWIMIILLIVLVLSKHSDNLNWKCSLTILLLLTELLQMFAYLPTLPWALHIHMFWMVMKSFMKNFLFYSLFVGAFGLCFYIMIGLNGEPKENLNGFNSTVNVVLKTTAMMIGELDTSSMKFNDPFTIALFLGFIFVVTIVLYNLINGSAIHDILVSKF